MLNSPLNSVFDPADQQSDSDLIAPGSAWRVYLIGVGFAGLLLVILARLVYVQTQLPERYLTALQATTTEIEILPARDGRILAGGTVLAADIEQYAIQVHYRWLQTNPDAVWLRQQIRNRLSRQERRDQTLVSNTEEQIAVERDQLRFNLATLTNLPEADVAASFLRIEQQVQRIADSVNRRHTNRSEDTKQAESDTASGTDSLFHWPMQIASQVRHALTTAPARQANQRIVVREEEAWHTVVENVSLSTAAQISEHPERFPGARIVSQTRRIYPQQQLAAHIVGAQTPLKEGEQPHHPLQISESTGMPDTSDLNGQRKGRFGVELGYADRLKGTVGIREVVRNRRQQIISSSVVRKPVSGRDVVLTIDPDLQHICEQLLSEALADTPRQLLASINQTVQQQADDAAQNETADDKAAQVQLVPTGGSIVVMDVQSGQILAAASGPTFNLQLFTGGSADDWQQANSDQRRPFVSRFSSMALPPGSTFKALTAVAALETGTFTSRQTFFCQGYLSNPNENRCLIFRQFGQGHGNLSLTAAMAQSCNVYFFDAARRMGILPLAEWAERFEFGQLTAIDLPFEKPGSLPVTTAAITTATNSGTSAGGTNSGTSAAGNMMANETNRSQAAMLRYQREALGFAIGQSRLTATPLQIARMMAAIANGGWLVTPHVVSEEGSARRADQDDTSMRQFPRHRISGLSAETLTAVRRGLTAVCEESYGTGYKTVRLSHVPIAGKTGTAETSPGKPDHAWFAGYAPANDPQIAFVVVLENGGSGSHAAGPVAREIVRAIFPAPAEESDVSNQN